MNWITKISRFLFERGCVDFTTSYTLEEGDHSKFESWCQRESSVENKSFMKEYNDAITVLGTYNCLSGYTITNPYIDSRGTVHYRNSTEGYHNLNI